MKRVTLSIIVLLALCLSLTSCDALKSLNQRDYTVGEMTITLSNFFLQDTHEDAEAFFYNASVGILVYCETFETIESFGGDSDIGLEEYANLRIEANNIETEVYEENGEVCYDYIFDSEGDEYKATVIIKKSELAFWVFCFYCLESDYETQKSNFFEYAASVTFDPQNAEEQIAEF